MTSPPTVEGTFRTALTKISDRASVLMPTKAALSAAMDDIGALASDALARAHDIEAGPRLPLPTLEEADRAKARHLYSMLADAFRLTESMASRACEAMEGTDGMLAFESARRELADFYEKSPALNVLRTITLPPR